jgi:hypothetical protein
VLLRRSGRKDESYPALASAAFAALSSFTALASFTAFAALASFTALAALASFTTLAAFASFTALAAFASFTALAAFAALTRRRMRGGGGNGNALIGRNIDRETAGLRQDESTGTRPYFDALHLTRLLN